VNDGNFVEVLQRRGRRAGTTSAHAASVGGFTVTGMWANEDGSGLTRYNSRKNRKLSDRRRRAALVATVAGQEAEIRYLMEHHGYRYRQALRETHAGAGGDREIFRQMARGTSYTFDGLRPEARSLVKWRWYTIESNAKPLARRGYRGGTWA
jgi:hypothetical protein